MPRKRVQSKARYEPPSLAEVLSLPADPGERAIAFFERALVHTKGEFANQPFILEPWQRDEIIRPLFGTLNDDGTRQYRTAFIFLPRKNGKSEMGAGIALYLLLADDEAGAEVYSAAADHDQASIVYDVAQQMAIRSPALSSFVRCLDSRKRIIRQPMDGSFYRVIPADEAGAHGFNMHGAVFDELHTQPNRHLYDALRTGMGARRQPLMVMITTAGHDDQSICREVYDYAKRVQSGEIDDPTFFAYIREAGAKDDWKDPAVWRTANPALGTFRSLAEMRQMAREAEQQPAKQNTFRRLYLNQWTSQETRWLDLAAWDACAAPVDANVLAGRRCYIGLDLSSTTDLSALVLLFPDDDGGYDILPFFWMPAATLRARADRDRAPYEQWVEQGLIEATPGNVIDYTRIAARLDWALGEFELVELAYDPWNATQFIQPYADALGEQVVELRQGYRSLSAPTKALLGQVLDGKLRHGGHPVLRWMADNVTVKQDENENIRPIKPRAGKRIDGITALIFAEARAILATGEAESVYDTKELAVW